MAIKRRDHGDPNDDKKKLARDGGGALRERGGAAITKPG